MAKRSPILGYNHNVRYRGLVFHVQTEDSGLLNPHLFTHLFHGGVIVSTRKLVYDAGANEEAIKALMQAQHKAVMKELRKGTFDGKIDEYLGGTPGLEPRGSGGAPAARGDRAPTEMSPPPANMREESSAPIEILHDGLSEPIELPVKNRAPDGAAPTPSRTQTGDKTTRVPKGVAPGMVDAPTLRASAGSVPDVARAPTVQRSSGAPEDELQMRDSSPILEMTVEEEDELSAKLRGMPRDTAVEQAVDPRKQKARPANVGAAALPKAPQRAATPPPVTSRAPTNSGQKDSAQLQPPPSDASGDRSERPGQYSVNRKDVGTQLKEKTGRIPQINPVAPSKRGSGPNPVVPGRGVPQTAPREGSSRTSVPAPHRPPTPASGSRIPQPPSRAGAPQVNSRVHATAPIANRSPAPAPPAPGSGVVMTRPAVIVGGPKPPAQQRVRKAREDEGRGFGQGLISEKSLDEVILAYLSEDAEDK